MSKLNTLIPGTKFKFKKNIICMIVDNSKEYLSEFTEDGVWVICIEGDGKFLFKGEVICLLGDTEVEVV